MGLFDTEAITLRKLRLGEADLLITFFTLRRGLLKGVARGARRPRSRFGASLEPLTYSHIVGFEKRPTVLPRINQSEILNPFLQIREDLERIQAASRMVQLIMALVPEGEPNPKMFDLLLTGLTQLNQGRDRDWLSRIFEIRCLSLSGYQARLDRCLSCRESFDHGPVFFSPKNGGTVCEKCARSARDPLQIISAGTLMMMRLMARMDWAGLFRLKASPRMKKEMQDATEAHIAFILGRPLWNDPHRADPVTRP